MYIPYHSSGSFVGMMQKKMAARTLKPTVFLLKTHFWYIFYIIKVKLYTFKSEILSKIPLQFYEFM